MDYAYTEDFFDLINDKFLIQHVREATRLNNVLDLVFSSEKDMIHDVSVLGHLGKSDHCMIIAVVHNC